MKRPIDFFDRKPRKSPFGGAINVYGNEVTRAPNTGLSLRAKCILFGTMGVAAVCTGMFINQRLANWSAETAPMAVAEADVPEAKPEPAAVAAKPEPKVSKADPAAETETLSEEELGALPHEDPRWVRANAKAPMIAAAGPAPTSTGKAARMAAETDEEDPILPDTAPLALAAEEPDEAARTADEQFTAAIPPAGTVPLVVSPEPEDQVDVAEPDNSDDAAAVVSGRVVRVNKAVNMRTRPRSGSKVIKVVPAGASVNVGDCKGWCQISYEGSTGYVYKSFISGSSQAARSSQPASAPAKPRQSASFKVTRNTAPNKPVPGSNR